MNVANWYRNGDLEAFRKFCIQNRKKLIAVKLITGSEIAKGILYNHDFKSCETAGVFILLTKSAVHPAFYALSDIESVHYMASSSLIQTSSVIPPNLSIIQDGLTYLL